MNKNSKSTFLLSSDFFKKLFLLFVLLALFWLGQSLTIYLLYKYPPQNIERSLQYISRPNIAAVFDYCFAPILIGLMFPLTFAGLFSKLPNRLTKILTTTIPITIVVVTFLIIYF